MATYSFLDVKSTLVGPGGSVNLGEGSAAAEEGITIRAVEDIDTMTIGADGTPMHSLHANKSAHVEVHVLKTSPINQKLAQMYALQTAAAVSHGQNTLTVTIPATGEIISCTSVAFKKAPDLTYAKEGGMNNWEFNAGTVDRVLGAY